MRSLTGLCLMVLLLAGCAQSPVVVGSKDTVQDRILGEILALTLEADGLQVTRRVGLGDSADLFQALKSGTVDVYPEYSGTALALLDAPPEATAEAVRARLAEPFSALGLEFLAPLGFESQFVPVTRQTLARRFQLKDLGDLAPASKDLRLGVSRSFAERPRDGLAGLTARFGLDFRNVIVVPEVQRETLYQRLLDGDIDVMIGFSTDPQIADYGLVSLTVDRPYFPAYEAAPLTSVEAIARHPTIAEALAPISGAIDATLMTDMVRQVQVAGRTPRAVAATALARLGVAEGNPPTPPEIPLAIALGPHELGSAPANRALDAVRTAMPGRATALLPTPRPLEALATGEARMAVVPAAAHFRLSSRGAVRDETVEAIGVVGQSVLYAIAREDGPARLGGARVVATGPEGSPSHLVGAVIVLHSAREVTLAPQADASAAAIGAAIHSGLADAGLVIASRQRGDVVELLRGAADLQLVDASEWWQGAARLALPFMAQAVLLPDTHPGLDAPVSVLAMQTVITGATAPEAAALGRQGPISYDTRIQSLSDTTVRAIDRALGTRPDISASLRAAPALTPRLPEVPTARNPSPDQAFLTVGILAFLGFAGWLLVRRRKDLPR